MSTQASAYSLGREGADAMVILTEWDQFRALDLDRVRTILRPDGYLFLGGAETTLNLDAGFERVQIHNAPAYRLRSERKVISRVSCPSIRMVPLCGS